MIIDSHIHLPPLGSPQKWDYILEEACKNEINLMVLSHLGNWAKYPEKNVVKKANIAAKEFSDYAKGKVLWLAYINPQLKNWRKELKTCVKNGACGIKLWICLKNSKGSLKNTVELLNEAVKYKLPVLLHTYNRTDQNHAGEITTKEFAKLSSLCPDCVMIAAHAGGNWRHSLGMLKECSKNAYVDICGGYPEQGMLEALSKEEGTDRILFGSDATGRSFASQVAKVIFAEIDDDAKENIFWKNAVKAYNIQNVPPLIEGKKTYLEKSELPPLAEDHFCFCGTWPFWESPCKTPQALDKVLTGNKIPRAYVGDLSSLFRLDLLVANRKFLTLCKDLAGIMPLATLNPLANNWQQLVLDAAKQNFAGGFISPYLHCWRLDDPAFTEFFQLCADKKFKLWVNCDLVDHRFRHHALAARPLVTAELTAFMKKAPDNQYVFQGVCPVNIAVQLERFNDDERFFFEFSRITDRQVSMQEILAKYGKKRLVAGSEFPFRHIKQTRYVVHKL
jgi:uncharacterized protein